MLLENLRLEWAIIAAGLFAWLLARLARHRARIRLEADTQYQTRLLVRKAALATRIGIVLIVTGLQLLHIRWTLSGRGNPLLSYVVLWFLIIGGNCIIFLTALNVRTVRGAPNNEHDSRLTLEKGTGLLWIFIGMLLMLTYVFAWYWFHRL